MNFVDLYLNLIAVIVLSMESIEIGDVTMKIKECFIVISNVDVMMLQSVDINHVVNIHLTSDLNMGQDTWHGLILPR
jgi:hypothetical protein